MKQASSTNKIISAFFLSEFFGAGFIGPSSEGVMSFLRLLAALDIILI